MKRTGRAAVITLIVGVAASVLPPSAAATLGHRHRSPRAEPAHISTPLRGAVAVSPTSGASTAYDPINLIAGSSDFVVYRRAQTASIDSLFGPSHLYVVYSTGDVAPLGVQPNGDQWSVAGTMVTSIPAPRSTTVNWIDVSDDSSGSGSIPDHALYLGATTNGWAYVLGNQVFTETTSGTTTSLGYPLGNASGEFVASGGTGPAGLIAADTTGAMAYVPYADPTHPVMLDTDVSSSDPQAPLYFACRVRVVDALCNADYNQPPESFVRAGERLSLTGGAAVSVPPPSGESTYADAAIDDQATAVSTLSNFVVTNPDGTGAVSESVRGQIQLLSAFNKIVRTNQAGTAIETFDAPGDTPAVLVPPTMSRIQAYSPSQTTGRVVYLDDQVSPSSAPAPYVWSRPVSNHGRGIDLGTPTYVGTLDEGSGTDGALQGPRASGSLTAYLRTSRFDRPPYRFVRPVLPTSWMSGHTRSIATLSGNRVLTISGDVVDTSTKKVRRLRPVAPRPPARALWGDQYCYLKDSGLVACRDLSTGKRLVVRGTAKGDTASKPAYGGVWVYGSHLAWLDVRQSPRAVLIDLRHPAHRIRIPASRQIVSLTSNGVLLSKDTTTATTYFLRGYGRRARPGEVLKSTGDQYDRRLAIAADQSVLTWNGPNAIMAAPLRHVSDRPRFLGAPVAPKRARAGKANGWQAYLPYSASLSHCKVTVRRHHNVLRTLHCVRADMAYGGVVVSWNGRTKSGAKVTPGAVTWTVHASNADGHARAGDGSRKPVSGRIKITH